MSAAIAMEVARKLGGRPVLGTEVRSETELAAAVRKCLPLSALKGLAQAGLTDREIEQLVIPQRTRGTVPSGDSR
jgi:hypothetical protein